MVKRKVKLAQIVCAVYSLSKPLGASKREIARFCKLRFGSTCDSKELERILDRGLEEGLLTSFRKRYRVAKLHCGVIWAGDSGAVRNRRKGPRVKKNKGTKLGARRKRNSKPKPSKVFRRRVTFEEDSFKQTSSLYTLWKNELKRQIDRMKKSIRNVSNRGKSLCKKMKSGRTKSKTLQSQPKRQSLTQNRRTNKNSKKEKVVSKKLKQIKNAVKSRLAHKKDRSERNSKNGDRKKNTQNSGGSSGSIGIAAQRSEFHRSLLRQTKNAVVHGKSWDKLNFSRQRRTRENQEMVKKSQLVQKILTRAHAASWDDLNSKLKEMKEVASCSPQETRGNGDAASRHSLGSK